MLSPFKSPFRPHSGVALCHEADALEARLGAAGAVRHVREEIAQAGRTARQRLYRLHDEIARRHPRLMAS